MTKDEIEELSFKWTGVRSARNVDAETFIAACERGDIDFVREALAFNKSLVNAKVENDNSALGRAMMEGKKDIVKLLIDNGANVNILKQKQLDEFLIISVMQQKMGMAESLILLGADVNYALPTGVTALISAIQVNNMDIIKLLLKNGADVRKEVNLFGDVYTNAINFARYSVQNEDMARFLEHS